MRKYRSLIIIVFIGIVGMTLPLEAVVPRKWEIRTKDDFLKGKLDGLSVTFEGVISLAPEEGKLDGPAEDFYLSFLPRPDGTGFLGTGHGGRVYSIGKDGKVELYFQAQEMDVTCLAMDSKGMLFAGTSPNGKVYKITGKDQAAAFFNPGEKYIWDLVFADDGSLMAAVGEAGGIYRISPEGEGQRVLKAEENHILCLHKGGQGDFLAGSGGVGVVYRLSAAGRATVLFESSYEEIKSLAVDGDGNIYAACGGTPTRTKKEEPSDLPVRISTEVTVSAGAPAPTGVRSPAGSSSTAKEPGALFRVRPDGIAKKLWESEDELIYSLLWKEKEKRLLFGTGDQGRIYTVDREEKISLLLQGNSEQMYALEPVDTKICVLADNPARLLILSAEQRFNGEYISDVLDARTMSSWGRLEFDGLIPAGTTIQIQTRSGNSFEPNSMWSDWSPPIQKKEEQILSPKARYLQFKALLKTQSGNASPQLQRVSLFYLQTNIAPLVQSLTLLPPNEVYLKPPDQEEVIWGAEESAAGGEEKKKDDRSVFMGKKVERKGFQTMTWEVTDENGDRLLYTISIKKEGETAWRVVKDAWTESLIAIDTLSYPDGVYFLKLEAGDLGSNPPGSELRAEKISPPLVIDNSLPVVKNFTATRAGNALDVAFQVEDSFSSIQEVEYLVRPGDWRVVFPVDGICDSKVETFKFRVSLPPNAENLVTVRVTDRHHNIGVYRQTF
ncbi:MAG TPA: hypothetical protein VMW46_09905 [Candidatus Desulfaltia sp.]|nr:hypothetical protein [Candidatus Desulfaltia sp.]